MTQYGKRLRKSYESVDIEKTYSLQDALKFIKENATAKFDETLDISVNLNLDTRKAEQNLRGVVQLPNGTGKVVSVAVFASAGKIEEAKAAGADIVGGEELVAKVQKGFMDFDRCIATPDMMALVGRLGRVLGPRGLMPNPKLGTVTMDIAAAVEAVKGGQVEYRAEKTGIVHAGVGKASFTEEALKENVQAFVKVLEKIRPSGVKGTYIKRISLSSTMGAGLKINVQDCIGLAK